MSHSSTAPRRGKGYRRGLHVLLRRGGSLYITLSRLLTSVNTKHGCVGICGRVGVCGSPTLGPMLCNGGW